MASYLRLISDMNTIDGVVRTTVPPEPLVSEAVASLLSSSASAWPVSVHTLATKLLQPGLIDKGRSGELITRLLFVLGRDHCLSEQLEIGAAHVPAFDFAKPFKLLSFLSHLFTRPCYDQLAT